MHPMKFIILAFIKMIMLLELRFLINLCIVDSDDSDPKDLKQYEIFI